MYKCNNFRKYLSYVVIALFVIFVIIATVIYISHITQKSVQKNIDLEKLDTPIVVMDITPSSKNILVSFSVATLSDIEKIEKYIVSIGTGNDKFNIATKEIDGNSNVIENVEFSDLKPDTKYYIKLEYSYKSKEYIKISDEVITLEQNSSEISQNISYPYIFHRTAENINNGKIKVKDLTPPGAAKITMPTHVYVNQTFDATVLHFDSLSGIDVNECKYIFSTQKAGYGVKSVKWKSADKFDTQNQIIKLKATTEGTYYLHILSKDMFKNWRETTKSIKIVEDIGEGTRDKKMSAYNRPFIPKNFRYIYGKAENGFVIQDKSNGNEFVWIPVDMNSIKFERQSFDKYYYKSFSSYSEVMDKTIEQSIKKYGGYYIARFEAGVDKTSGNNIGVPVSRNNTKVWTYISRDIAKLSSELMYNDKEIKSVLMSSYMYDTALNWILSTNGIDGKISTNYGNYSDSREENNGKENTTGRNEKWKLNNIYDIAGNMWEWTTENFLENVAVKRGGSYLETGENAPLVYRDTSDPKYINNNISFRICLYIL